MLANWFLVMEKGQQDIYTAAVSRDQARIVFDDARFLDKQYTVWGQVVEGMEHDDALPKGEPPREPGKIVKAAVSEG